MFIFYLLPLLDYIFTFRGVFLVYLFLFIFINYRFGFNLNFQTFFKFLLIFIPIIWSIFLSNNYFNRDFQRSIFYLSLPPLTFMIGTSLGRLVKLKSIYKFIIYYGFMSVILYIIFSIFNNNFFNLLNPKLARGTFFFPKPLFSVLSIYLLIFYKNIKASKLILLINIYGIFIAGSRTYFLILLIFFVGRYFKLTIKNLLIFSTFLIGSLILIYSTGSFDNLYTELTFSSENSVVDIGSQYRGFESFKAIEKFFSGSYLQKFFGFGLNDNIDLGIDVDLGGYYMSEIPLLHNGFLYAIIRIGIIGLLFYFIFFYKIIFTSIHKYVFHEKFMIIAIITNLLLSNFVINSFYNLEFSVCWFLLGYYTNKNISHAKVYT